MFQSATQELRLCSLEPQPAVPELCTDHVEEQTRSVYIFICVCGKVIEEINISI